MHRISIFAQEVSSLSSLRLSAMANSSADAILERLTASNIFDLRGVVAVVTGGGTVSVSCYSSHQSSDRIAWPIRVGHRTDD